MRCIQHALERRSASSILSRALTKSPLGLFLFLFTRLQEQTCGVRFREQHRQNTPEVACFVASVARNKRHQKLPDRVHALAKLFLAWPDPMQPLPSASCLIDWLRLLSFENTWIEEATLVNISGTGPAISRDRLEILAARWPRLHARHA